MSEYQLGCVCHLKPELPDQWCDGRCQDDAKARHEVDTYVNQTAIQHDRIEALEVQLAAMSDYVERLTTQVGVLEQREQAFAIAAASHRGVLQSIEQAAFRYTLDSQPFWGIEDDVMGRLQVYLGALEEGAGNE